MARHSSRKGGKVNFLGPIFKPKKGQEQTFPEVFSEKKTGFLGQHFLEFIPFPTRYIISKLAASCTTTVHSVYFFLQHYTVKI